MFYTLCVRRSLGGKMRLQVVGYDLIKNGEWTVLHCLDLRQRANTVGLRPLTITRGGKVSEGLWIPKSLGFVASKEILNRVVNAEFGPSGSLISISLEK